MKIRAKFQCHAVTKDSGKNEIVRFTAVYGSGEANKQWSKYTPNGTLEMTISEEGAQGRFEPGKEYFLDITPADE